MTTNTDKQWRVEWRKDRKSKWVKADLFEVKADASRNAIEKYRIGQGVGLYNTRVTPYVKPKSAA